jgi:hypothetical protein
MTEAMETRLRDMPLAFLVLARLRRLVGDGNTIMLYGGVRGWAIWMDCSPGYPKQILNRLAHEGLVTVVYLDDGFAEVTVLPPPELADSRRADSRYGATPGLSSDDTGSRGAAVAAPQPGSPADRVTAAVARPRGRAVPRQSAMPVRSLGDPMSHESESDQLASQPRLPDEHPIQSETKTDLQSDPPTPAPAMPDPSTTPPVAAADPPPSDLSPAQQTLLDGLLAQQIYPALARRIVQQHPQLTLADFEVQVARLTARGVYAAPVFVAAKILARGETVAAPEPPRTTGTPRNRQPSDTIRLAGHITEAVRTEWLGYCAQYPADTANVVQEFLRRYPVPAQVEVA